MKKAKFIQPLTPSKKLVDGTVYFYSDHIAKKLNEMIDAWNIKEAENAKNQTD